MADRAIPQITRRWPKPGLRPLSSSPDFPNVISTADSLAKGDKRVYSAWRLHYLQFIDGQEDLFTLLEKGSWNDHELPELIERYHYLVSTFEDIRSVLANVFARSEPADRFAHFPYDETFLTRDLRSFDRQWGGVKEALRQAVDRQFEEIRDLLRCHLKWYGESWSDGSWDLLLEQAEEARERGGYDRDGQDYRSD